jgi:predicted ester cyclase
VPLEFTVQSVEFTELFSSGDEVAFHARQTGQYQGGIAGLEASTKSWLLNVNGLLRVQEGQVVSGRIIRDRSGLKARLQQDLKA